MTLDVKKLLAAIDLRNHDFYNNLTDEEKKEFNPYILMRFSSNVNANPDIEEWFVETTNELVNKNYSSISKHKDLLWKLYASTGVGLKFFHPYLAAGKKEKAIKIEKLLAELNPAMKLSEVKLLAGLMNKKDIDELFDSLGFDKKQRKEYE